MEWSGRGLGVVVIIALGLVAMVVGCGEDGETNTVIDPCEAVDCVDPPSSECVDDDTVELYAEEGQCQEGECSYDGDEQSCDFGCEQGACIDDPCEGVDCEEPSPECLDEETLLEYSAGRCEEGECAFETVEQDCEFGCEAGACKGDPCDDDITCEDPPSPHECYESTGSCVDGECVYAPLDGGSCDDGDLCTENAICQNGECVDGQAIDCSEEDGQCAQGVCDESTGECVSTPANEGDPCDDGDLCTENEICQSGECVDGQAIDCSEEDGQCAQGVCDESTGECVSTPANEGDPCDDGDLCTDGAQCSDGGCQGAPISCQEAPDDECVASDTLKTYDNTGICEAASGDCIYDSTEVVCPSGACSAGACSVVSEGSLYFQGDLDHVRIPVDAHLEDYEAFTVEAWIKTEDAPETPFDETIVSQWREQGARHIFRLTRETTNERLAGRVGGPSSTCLTQNAGLSTGSDAWHHVAISWTENWAYPRIYIDGEMVSQSSCSQSNLGSLFGDILIGAREDNGEVDYGWEGWIAEVRIWDNRRGEDAILGTMNQTLSGEESGLLGYWPLGEGSGTTAFDESNWGNHGSLESGDGGAMPQWSDDSPFD